MLAGCGNNSTPTPAPFNPSQYIDVRVSEVTLEAEGTFQIEVDIIVEHTIVFFSSNNKDVATVSREGLITAVKEGTTSINVRGGKDYYSVFVTVIPYQAKDTLQISLTKNSFTLEKNDEFVLPITVKYGNGAINDYSISYIYEHSNIVNINGLNMTAVNEGTTKVVATATYRNIQASEIFTVTVY